MTKRNASTTKDELARRDVLKLGATGAAAAGLAGGLGSAPASGLSLMALIT